MPGSWPAHVFPNLTDDVHEIKSAYDRNYNCIAFAADDQTKWWWPASQDDYWPASVTNLVTMDAFVEAFGTLGYIECIDGSLESGFEKVALYGKPSAGGRIEPTHMAKQLPDGRGGSDISASAILKPYLICQPFALPARGASHMSARQVRGRASTPRSSSSQSIHLLAAFPRPIGLKRNSARGRARSRSRARLVGAPRRSDCMTRTEVDRGAAVADLLRCADGRGG